MIKQTLCAVTIGSLIAFNAHAADIRIIDSAGLMRAARVVRDLSRVTVVVEEPKGLRGECLLTNIDGIASERRESVSSAGMCVFTGVAAGTWQVKVTGALRWRVVVEE